MCRENTMKKYKNTIYYISLLLTVVYLVYRLFFTLPNKLDISFVFACIVLLVEIVDAFFYFVFTINILTVNIITSSYVLIRIFR